MAMARNAVCRSWWGYLRLVRSNAIAVSHTNTSDYFVYNFWRYFHHHCVQFGTYSQTQNGSDYGVVTERFMGFACYLWLVQLKLRADSSCNRNVARNRHRNWILSGLGENAPRKTLASSVILCSRTFQDPQSTGRIQDSKRPLHSGLPPPRVRNGCVMINA